MKMEKFQLEPQKLQCKEDSYELHYETKIQTDCRITERLIKNFRLKKRRRFSDTSGVSDYVLKKQYGNEFVEELETHVKNLQKYNASDYLKGKQCGNVAVGELRTHHENKTFNLGNCNMFTDPKEVADYLLEREYHDIFNKKLNKAVFIPPVFYLKQYDKSIPELTGNMLGDIKNINSHLNKHYSKYWFTVCLNDYINKSKDGYGILKNYDCWIVKMKLLYLINSESEKEIVPQYQKFDGGLKQFADKCIKCHRDSSQRDSLIIKKIDGKDANSLKILLKQEKVSAIKDSMCKEYGRSLCVQHLLDQRYDESSGQQTELYLYQKLKENEEILSDFVILSSLDIYTCPGGAVANCREHDFILISAERKLIISIEAKTTLNGRKKNKAKEQLEACKSMFENKFKMDNEWTFYPAIFTFERKCKLDSLEENHIITLETDIKDWLIGLLRTYRERPINESLESSRNQLKAVVKILIFCLYKGHHPITTTNWVNSTRKIIDKISTTDTILFYSEEQLQVLYGQNGKRIVIEGGFGTGKSILLLAKAEMLAKKGEKVCFIFGSGSENEKSLLQLKVEEKLKQYGNIKVKKFASDISPQDLKNLVKDTKSHIFIDELFIGESFVETMLDAWKDKKEYCWVVFHRMKSSESLVQKFKNYNFSLVKLTVCLRNTKSVCDIGNKYLIERYQKDGKRHNVECPSNSPIGKKFERARNTEEALELAKKNGWISTAAECTEIQGIVYYIKHARENKARIWFERFYKEFSDSMQSLTDLNVKVYSTRYKEWGDKMINPYIESIEESKDCLEFLKEKNSVLVIDNAAIMEGFEWPNIIYDARVLELKENESIHRNDIFRTMVQFIAILSPEEYKQF